MEMKTKVDLLVVADALVGVERTMKPAVGVEVTMMATRVDTLVAGDTLVDTSVDTLVEEEEE